MCREMGELLRQDLSLFFKMSHSFLADFNCTANFCLEVSLTDLFSISSFKHSHIMFNLAWIANPIL